MFEGVPLFSSMDHVLMRAHWIRSLAVRILASGWLTAGPAAISFRSRITSTNGLYRLVPTLTYLSSDPRGSASF